MKRKRDFGSSAVSTKELARGSGSQRRRNLLDAPRFGKRRAFEALEERRVLSIDQVPWVEQGPGTIFNSSNVQTANPGDPLGGNLATGAINVALPSPLDSGTIYVGTVNGGIWKTSNAGSFAAANLGGPTWVNLTANQPSLSIRDLELDPLSPAVLGQEVLVAGIGRTSAFGQRGGELIGLMRSINGGTSWQVIDGNGLLAGREISAVAPLGDTILVGVDND